jgi:hypothetical protein
MIDDRLLSDFEFVEPQENFTKKSYDTSELLRGMGCTEEQRLKYTAYKFYGKAKRWLYHRRDLLVMELGSDEAITWTRFKEEFYRKYFPN